MGGVRRAGWAPLGKGVARCVVAERSVEVSEGL